MNEDSLGLELRALYRRLRQASDPAVKAVIRRRIDARLGEAEDRFDRRPPPPRQAGIACDTGAD